MPFEQLPVEPGLVVVALQEGEAGELDEVPVPDVVLGQQGEVVVELPAALGLAAGVVDAAAPGGPLRTRVVGLVGLEPEDRLHAVVAAGPVEVQDAVHVAVVRDAERWLAVGGGGRH